MVGAWSVAAEVGGYIFEEIGFGSPFLTAESCRLDKGIALVGIVAMGCCAARRSRSNIQLGLACLGLSQSVSVHSAVALGPAVVFEDS